jgi:predicted dithiol-disulfide oxidoreductase (DUF899 family)
LLDQLDGAAEHAAQHVNIAVAAKAPIERVLTFATERGWRRLRMLSSADTTYTAITSPRHQTATRSRCWMSFTANHHARPSLACGESRTAAVRLMETSSGIRGFVYAGTPLADMVRFPRRPRIGQTT